MALYKCILIFNLTLFLIFYNSQTEIFKQEQFE